MGDGVMFSVAAYASSREDMTAEFEQLMPGMVGFVRDWLHLHDRTRSHKVALTAKSYFLQEAEGLSRQAKVAWAMRRGDARVANLQHDGVVVELPEGVAADDAVRGMSAACVAILGYEQPVEEKPLGADVRGSDSEDDGEEAADE